MSGLFWTFHLRLYKVYGKSELTQLLHGLRKKKEVLNSSLSVIDIIVDAGREKKPLLGQGALAAGNRRHAWLKAEGE